MYKYKNIKEDSKTSCKRRIKKKICCNILEETKVLTPYATAQVTG